VPTAGDARLRGRRDLPVLDNAWQSRLFAPVARAHRGFVLPARRSPGWRRPRKSEPIATTVDFMCCLRF